MSLLFIIAVVAGFVLRTLACFAETRIPVWSAWMSWTVAAFVWALT